ncbi:MULTISPECIES: malate dehydrogenase [Haloferacaceae]|uniref:malate dehydrogenase n=1 Tax=Halorubrum glutamatedens TaxID=2707018 RepID=A0ABD5QQY8_9EURY|nr:lactate dehydrogenase [Halobellus captivus]
MEVAFIGGAGTVGATAAYTLAVERPSVDVTLVDVEEDAAEGHGIGIRHARTLGSLPQFGDANDLGSVSAKPSSAAGLATADVAVVTASVPRPGSSAKRGGRLEFLDRNLELAESIAGTLREREPLPVIVVSNPMDRITQRIWRETGWDRDRFLGYSLSETGRTADRIASIRDVPAEDVYCPVGGEHGENVVPFFSRLTVDGEPTTLTEAEKRDVRDYVRDVPYDVIELRGAEETSRWVTGQGVVRLVCAVLDDGLDDPDHPIAASVPLDGEYGIEDACVSVPVEVGRTGVRRVIEWDLPEEELEGLRAAAESVAADPE